VDYQEINMATRRGHFPLPFIDQVLDVLSSKEYFSFMDGFSGYNQIQIGLEDQDKKKLLVPGEHLLTYSYLSAYAIPHPLSKEKYLACFQNSSVIKLRSI